MRDYRSTLAYLVSRDGARCYLCGQGQDADDPFEIEHVIPRAAGGSDDIENLKLAHRSCNRAKGTSAVAAS